MKTRQSMMWAVMAMLLLSALPTEAAGAFGTVTKHYCYGTKGSWKYRRAGHTYSYRLIDVPANAAKLTVETGTDSHGGYGNCSLYVRYGRLPTATSPNTGVSRFPGFRQRAELVNPPAGRYYIRLYARSNYRTCIKTIITPKSVNTSGWKADLLKLMNFERGKAGMAALRYNTALERAATLYAQDLATYKYTGHTGRDGSQPIDRVRNQGYSWYANENLRYGYGLSGSSYVPLTVNQIMYGGEFGWMTEPEPAGHKWAILNRTSTEVGFGRGYNSSAKYKYYWCADFGRR